MVPPADLTWRILGTPSSLFSLSMLLSSGVLLQGFIVPLPLQVHTVPFQQDSVLEH